MRSILYVHKAAVIRSHTTRQQYDLCLLATYGEWTKLNLGQHPTSDFHAVFFIRITTVQCPPCCDHKQCFKKSGSPSKNVKTNEIVEIGVIIKVIAKRCCAAFCEQNFCMRNVAGVPPKWKSKRPLKTTKGPWRCRIHSECSCSKSAFFRKNTVNRASSWSLNY